MKTLAVITGLIFISIGVFGQTGFVRPSNGAGATFTRGKASLPKRHFVDYPKANHSHLHHVYRHVGSHGRRYHLVGFNLRKSSESKRVKRK